MFKSIVVGTDGSETATEAVRQAVDLAKQISAKLELVSAYEPVSDQRLREERTEVPDDVQWMVNPREDVDATLRDAAELAKQNDVQVEIYARQGDPADAIRSPEVGLSQLTCGVAVTRVTPASTCARASASVSSIVGGPSSMPGRM